MSRIAVDVDDVLFPFVETLRVYLHENHGVAMESMPDPISWDLAKCWNIDKAKLWNIASVAVNQGMLLSAGPIDGAVEALSKLRAGGHSIHIITARFGGRAGVVHKDTYTWLLQHGIPFDSLTFSHDKSILQCDWSIDDRPENCDAFRESGAMAILMDQSWNQAHRGWRVKDMNAFAEIVSYTTG